MVSSQNLRILHYTGLFSLPIMAALTLLPPTPALAGEPSKPEVKEQTQPSAGQNEEMSEPTDPVNLGPSPAGQNEEVSEPTDPVNLRPLAQDGSLLSMEGGQRLMKEASSAAAAQDYEQATKKYQQAREVFNQLSNFYQKLAGSFSGIDNRIAESQRQKALDTAQMRDQATYELALVHRTHNQPELAVPLLIQIIQSQQPTRPLGQKAYQQLWELGFVESPYAPPGAAEPTSSNPR